MIGVKSHRGTQFRIWATQRLREYIVKSLTMDDERATCSWAPTADGWRRQMNKRGVYL